MTNCDVVNFAFMILCNFHQQLLFYGNLKGRIIFIVSYKPLTPIWFWR